MYVAWGAFILGVTLLSCRIEISITMMLMYSVEPSYVSVLCLCRAAQCETKEERSACCKEAETAWKTIWAAAGRGSAGYQWISEPSSG
jgi:hypothetical protein